MLAACAFLRRGVGVWGNAHYCPVSPHPPLPILFCPVFYYYVNLGLTNREAVALTGGGHSIGGADVEATGWNGTFT